MQENPSPAWTQQSFVKIKTVSLCLKLFVFLKIMWNKSTIIWNPVWWCLADFDWCCCTCAGWCFCGSSEWLWWCLLLKPYSEIDHVLRTNLIFCNDWAWLLFVIKVVMAFTTFCSYTLNLFNKDTENESKVTMKTLNGYKWLFKQILHSIIQRILKKCKWFPQKQCSQHW